MSDDAPREQPDSIDNDASREQTRVPASGDTNRSIDIAKTIPKVLEQLPEEHRAEVARVIQQVSYQGPLPPPEMMVGYNQIIPNGADRLMSLLEKQTLHRHALELGALDIEREKLKIERDRQSFLFRLGARGQQIAGLIALGLGAVGWHVTVNGHDAVGGVIFSTTIVGLVTVFLVGRKPKGDATREGEHPKERTSEGEPKSSLPQEASLDDEAKN